MVLKSRLLNAMLAATLCAWNSHAVIRFNNTFYSPRNREHSIRKSTTLIILHTTEAPSGSALRKLRDLGECHYCIDERGIVYRIIDHRREAYHAGRSMWNGRTNVDCFSVGIEVCGYHNKPLAAAQYTALQELVGELKHIYKIPDHNVLAHSHVAYGAPNKWHRRSHRGRKRCGMMFAQPAVRARLNLKARPLVDPDVRARRLVVGDAYLANVLYGGARTVPVPSISAAPDTIAKGQGAWDIAREAYNKPDTLYIFPNGVRKRGHQIADFRKVPAGTKVMVNAKVDNLPETYQVIGINGGAREIAGDEVRAASTIYVYSDGRYVRGSHLSAELALKLPYGTRVLTGYAVGGPVTAQRPASSFCGSRWRLKDTFFLISGVLVTGDRVDDTKIPAGTMFFYKN